jgi:RHS repeat-associated protein
MGTGPDHGLYDVYLDGSLWQSFDGYAGSPGTRAIVISTGIDSRKLGGEGPHLLEIRNRIERNKQNVTAPPVYKLRFQQLTVSNRTWTQQTIRYSYDRLARLKQARYAPGINALAADADLLRQYLYTFDRSGNRTSQSVSVNGAAPTVTNYTYNAANQLTQAGSATLTYDPNGNLTNDGTNAYTWDRANRMLSMGGASYKYDGAGRRVQQTIGATVTNYLLDIQPGLPVVLSETSGAATTRYIHGPRGPLAQKDASNNWEWMLQDGLGSVRGVTDNAVNVLWAGNYDGYGTGFDAVGTAQTSYGFTAEPQLQGGLVHLRARNYNPALGVFTALDPFEGVRDRAMSLNGYSWVEGNVPNRVDPSGYTFTEDEITSGRGEYSCNCGWIDWEHTQNWMLMQNILKNLLFAASSGAIYWGIRVEIGVNIGFRLSLFEDIAVIPDTEIKRRALANRESLEELAISILMNANEAFENAQYNFEKVAFFSHSGYSEEDYVSDLIGAYMGREIVFKGRDIEDIKAEVRRFCGAFGKEESLKVWRNTYANGDNLVYGENGWKAWYPRILQLLDCKGQVDLSNSITGNCNKQTRLYPQKLADLVAKYIPPQREIGTWWWLAAGFTGWLDGKGYPGGKENHTDLGDNLYRLNSLLLPTPPQQPTPIGTPAPSQ